MPRSYSFWLIFSGLLIFGSFTFCFAGGERPAPPSPEAVRVDAKIEDLKGKKHEWSRVKITCESGAKGALQTRHGEASIALTLAKISKISFRSDTPDEDGYVEAEMKLVDGSTSICEVKVEEDDEPVKLKGLTLGGVAEIDLIKCKSIEFSCAATASGESLKRSNPDRSPKAKE